MEVFIIYLLGLTQLGECDSYKVEVTGSSPVSEIKAHTAN